jgi:hypothetical protein
MDLPSDDLKSTLTFFKPSSKQVLSTFEFEFLRLLSLFLSLRTS